MKTFEILAAVSLMAISVPVDGADVSGWTGNINLYERTSPEMWNMSGLSESAIQMQLQTEGPYIRLLRDKIIISRKNVLDKLKSGFKGIKQKFKKRSANGEETFDVNATKLEEADVLMRQKLYPTYVRIYEIMGKEPIADFTVNKKGQPVKIKRNAKEVRNILDNLAREIGKKDEKPYDKINLKKVAKYIEQLAKEIGFKVQTEQEDE